MNNKLPDIIETQIISLVRLPQCVNGHEHYELVINNIAIDQIISEGKEKE